MRVAAVFAIVLLLAAFVQAAAAAQMDVALPPRFSVAQGVVIGGHVDLPSGRLAEATFLSARDAVFEPGSLTVCPVVTAQGSLQATLRTVLGGLDATCTEGETFLEPHIRFGAATTLVTNGTMAIQHMPDAALASFAADGVGGLVLSADGLAVARPDDLFRFIPTTRDAQVFVTTDSGTHVYNGTDHAFLHDGAAARWHAAAVAGSWGTGLHLTVGPARTEAMADALRPFELLDIEEALRGADAREPLGNVSGLLYEYGRVPAFVNGAVLGRLSGTARGVGLDGVTVALVRGDHFDLVSNGKRLSGSFDPRLLIAPAGVAAYGLPPMGPPWLLAGLLWACAGTVMAVRRRSPVRTPRTRLVWWIAVPVAALIVDKVVVGGTLGASAIGSFGSDVPAGAVSSLAVFEVLATGLAWLLVAVPVRVIVGRFASPRALPLVEGVVALGWLALVFLVPGAMFALAHSVSRI